MGHPKTPWRLGWDAVSLVYDEEYNINMNQIKSMLKKLIPKKILNLRHLFWAWYGAVKYKHPSEELLVIGITGTSGKSTTAYLLRQLLESSGHTVGVLSTIDFYIAGLEKLNDQKMTMLGRMKIQKYLRKMVEKGCDIAIVETTSEGRVQHRHKFINYDMMILTNLYPEHIESHGSFEAYKQAKLDLFDYVANHKSKIINNKSILKTAIVNKEVKGFTKFLDFNFENKIKFGIGSDFEPKDIIVDKNGLHFKIHDREFNVSMYGEHNIYNILAVVVIARQLDISWSVIQEATNEFKNVPGRVEFIKEAEEYGFQVIVDYAFEPHAMTALYQIVDLLKPKRVIHVFGSTGGGRDKERRFTVGSLIGERADICIVTDEDSYDDDPMEIINDVASAVAKTGKIPNKNLFKILDRGEGIKKALEIAREEDLILVTGKGSEQAMCIAGGRMIAWDDREEVRKNLALL